MPRTTPEQRARFERHRREQLEQIAQAVTAHEGRRLVTRAELAAKCDRLEKMVLELASEGGMVRFDVHIAVRPKGLTPAERQCGEWMRTANDLEQRAIKVEKRLGDLQREVRAALDGLDRDGAPAEILRRALEQSAARLHRRRRSSRKITPKGRR